MIETDSSLSDGAVVRWILIVCGAAVLVGFLVSCVAVPASAEPVLFNESLPGDRNLGQPFTWTMNNVSMQADSTYHFAVYDYRFIGDHYDYWSVSWGQWFNESAVPGNQYLAVWVRGWLEGTSYFGWGSERFYVWVGNQTIKAEPVKMQDVSIRNVGSYGRSTVVSETGCALTSPAETSGVITEYRKPAGSGRFLPVVISQLENLMARNERGHLTRERYGWKDENELDRMVPGYSERYDGVILYQVPNWTRPEDVRVAGWFGYWGTPVWHLSETQIVQESEERARQLESLVLDMERETGIRLPDKPGIRIEA